MVDITNYVLMELGHPLHAFDLHKLEYEQVIVRRAGAGESVETLDGVSRELNPEILVIADGRKPIAVAGIMGAGIPRSASKPWTCCWKALSSTPKPSVAERRLWASNRRRPCDSSAAPIFARPPLRWIEPLASWPKSLVGR